MFGDNGILNKAEQAKDTKEDEALEKVKLAVNASYGASGKMEYGDISDNSKLEYNINNIDGLNSTSIIQKSLTISDFPLVLSVDGYNFLVSKDGDVSKTEDQKEIKVGLISDTEYKINNTTLTFDHIVVVGSGETYTTVKQAFDYFCSCGYKNNLAIILKAGNYSMADMLNGTSDNINIKYDQMNVSIIADEPGKVFLNGGNFGLIENGSQYVNQLKFYRIVFNSVYGDGFHLEMDSNPNEYYNCVFNAPVGGLNYYVSNASAKIVNSIFLQGGSTYYTANPIQGLAQNCASINTVIDPEAGTKTTCLTNATFDSSFNITSAGWRHTGTGTNPDGTQANIGVYGGDFAWNYIDLSEVNGNIQVNANSIESNYTCIKYMYGTVDEATIKNNGKTIVNGDNIPIVGNGIYTVIAILNNNIVAKGTYVIEGKDINSDYKINNTILSFKRIIRVGTNEECTTVKQAFDYLKSNGYNTGGIVLDSGTYSMADMLNGASYNFNVAYNQINVSIIADEPGKVFLNGGNFGLIENGSQYANQLKFYRIVFNSIYGDGFHLEMDSMPNEYYNCVFNAPVGGLNYYVSNASAKIVNSIFLQGGSTYYTSYPIQGLAQNCASINTVIDPKNGIKTTCLTNATFDSSYNITSAGWKNAGTGTNPDGTQANIGVYGGDFSW